MSPPTETPVHAWERRPGETAKAYEAFCAYRDLGPSRSLDKAYRVLAGLDQNSTKTGPSHWSGWSRDYGWVSRAEAYDAHLELLGRKEQEAAHFAELEAFRHRQKRLAQTSIESAIALLKKGNDRLAGLKLSKIPASAVPQFFRAAAAVAEAGTNAEAQAIAVDHLLTLLDPDRTPGGGA